MNQLKFTAITLGNFFKRKGYDPTRFQAINEEWDETTSGSNTAQSHLSASGRYQNYKVPLSERIDEVNKKLALYDESLPNLKK